MLFSRKIIEKILPQFTKKTDLQFIDAVASTGNELPNKDIFFHPKLNNLTVGKIISFEPIPNTHLNYCTVQIDKKGKTKKIICGAPNVTKDKLVIVANENAVLHDGRIIANREIKGILSEGMLCGYNELTPLNSSFISKYDSEGILLIEEGEIEIGSDSSKIADFLGLNDTIYDIEVPFSNRHDIEGLLCFLQDIAGFFKIKYSFPTSSFKKISNQKSSTSSIKFDKKACNGYCLIKIDNISVKESNWEIKKILMNNGIKPLNNILDLLNLITLYTNIPTAVYDSDLVKKINVNFAKDGETFTGFNEKQYTLSSSDIVIRNEKERIICLAGILGDNSFGLNKNTKNILIEVANFDFVSIRETAKKFDIQTSSASKMSKKIPNSTTLVAASMVKEIFSSHKLGKYIDEKIMCEKEKPLNIPFDEKYISSILGSPVTKDEIFQHLKWLGFSLSSKKNCVIPPSYRTDVLNDQDIAEEIIKSMHVNDYLPEPVPYSNYVPNKYNEWYFIKNINDALTSSFFNEIITLNLTNKENAEKFNFFNLQNIQINTSVNSEKAFLRVSTIHQLLSTYKRNIAYKNDLFPIYELQKIYDFSLESKWTINILSPKLYKFDNFNNSQITYNINGLIGVIDKIASIFNKQLTYKPFTQTKYFFNNESIEIIYGGKTIGFIGLIKNSILKGYNIEKEEIYCAVLDWKSLYDSFIPPTFISKTIPSNNLMNIYKDLSFISNNQKYLFQTIEKAKFLDFVIDIKSLDKFIKPDESIAYTFRFFFDNSKTYTNDQINSMMNKVIQIFEDDGFKLNSK